MERCSDPAAEAVHLSSRLPVLGRAQVGGDGVVLDGLVQHQSQQPGPVGHGRPQVPLLLKQLVQLVPLMEGRTGDVVR